MNDINIKEITNGISSEGAKWKAAETSLFKLPKNEKLRRLGFTPKPGDKSLQERENIAKEKHKLFNLDATVSAGAPSVYDLRNVNGQNFITNIRDQGSCGSCVAFGTAATVEGTSRRLANNPNLNIDLSEAHLFYCYGHNDGRNCENGWWPDNALNHLRNDGVVDEGCYPYTAGDQNCSNLCSNWTTRLTKISNWHSMTSTTEMKNWISTKGPIVACFTVYDDFYSYTTGIYSHVRGNVVGGHCVSVIGYSDTEQYWICKNSWGTTFGENGFFRIAYGQCGIDAEMWAVDGIMNMGKWIRCLYLDLLNREPDQGGFNYWVDQLNRGTSITSISYSFLHSPEYCTITAESLYAKLLDRHSDPGGLNYWRDYLVRGNSLQNAINGFCNSAEYKSRHPIPNQFVESLYNKLLGRHSDPGGFQYWVNKINSGTNTVDIINGFLRSREYALQRMTEFYQKFLGRQPDSGGLDYWANKVQNGISLQEIAKGFLTSAEYQMRSQSR